MLDGDPRQWDTCALVERCIAQEREAWEEFFRRYMPKIKLWIVKTLLRSKDDSLDALFIEESVMNVFENVFVKLYTKSVLRTLNDRNSLLPWLRTLTVRAAKDWLKSQHAKSRLIEITTKDRTISSDAPSPGADGLKVANILQPPEGSKEDLAQRAEKLLERLKQLPDEQKWPLRLRIMFICPLDKCELQHLAQFVGTSPDQTAERVKAVMASLEKKKEKKIKEQKKADRLWNVAQNLAARLLDRIRQEEIPSCERQRLEEKIESILKRVREKTRAASLEVQPSNKQIAQIMGRSSKNVSRVSRVISMARKKLLEVDTL